MEDNAKYIKIYLENMIGYLNDIKKCVEIILSEIDKGDIANLSKKKIKQIDYIASRLESVTNLFIAELENYKEATGYY